MPFIDDRQFRKSATQLKRSAEPEAWDNFLGALEAYTWDRVAETVQAELATVQVAQGSARQAQKLLQLFKDAGIEPKQETAQ